MKVNSLYRFDEGDIPCYKSASQCLDRFDNFPPKPSKKKDDEDFECFAEMIRPIFFAYAFD